MSPRDTLLALVVAVAWGLNFAAAKIGVAELPPIFYTALRFVGVAVLLAPFFRPTKAEWKGIIIVSFLLGVCHFGFMFIGMSGVDAATTAIAIQLQVPFSTLLAAIFFQDMPGWRRLAGIGLAFGGVALLAGEPSLPNLFPFMMVVAAAFGWALSNVVIKKTGPLSPFALNGWMALLAVPQLLALSMIFEEGQWDALAAASTDMWIALAYTVLGSSLLAYSLWYKLIARYSMNQVVPFTLLAPVVGAASGVLILGEALSVYKVVGGVLTIAGVALIQFRELARIKKPVVES